MMKRFRSSRLVLSLALLAVAAPATAGAAASTATVVAIRVEGVIGPAVAAYIERGLKQALDTHAAALLIELDTPGGLLDSTRDIVSAMVNSPMPVLLYVAPRGARATSAGVFLMMAADVAAMAPETHLGAAHPVSIGGGNASSPPQEEKKEGPEGAASGPRTGKPGQASRNPMSDKAVSDASAYIRALAHAHGRNAAWAEQAVRESVSLTGEEAKKKNVIDLIALSRDDLFAQASGREIVKAEASRVLALEGARVIDLKMSLIQRFFHFLGHPNVAYILMMLGIYGLIYEFASPGVGFGAAAGVTCLLLAFYSLRVLPVNAAAAALVVLGLLLLLADVFTAATGLLSVGGLIALTLGSVLLIDRHPIPFPRISFLLVAPTIGVTGLFFFVAARKALAARRLKSATGAESLIGAEADVRQAFSPEGLVYLNGELWQARGDETVSVGDRVVVIGRQGPVLIVKKK